MSEYREGEGLFKAKFDSFTRILESSGKVAVFTGAGVSTLSGIPDFRGKHGVYTSPWKGLPVEEILSIDYFYREPGIFYAWAEEVWYHLEDYEPNICHKALAKMEQKGLLNTGLFTQNIDFMHQRAGSRLVYELHGSARSAEISFSQADLAIVLGSSLTVYPAAAFPELTHYNGGRTVIVNAQPTAQDRNAALVFKDIEQFSMALDGYLDTI